MNIFYNFFITLKRYTTSAVLNIVGLSLAFAAFIVLFIQFNFEHGYEKYNRNAERTFRVSMVNIQDASDVMTTFSQQIIDALSLSSPHIAYASMNGGSRAWQKNQNIKITRPNGGIESFDVDFIQVYNPFIAVADINIVEGDPNALDKPWNAIISKSMARTMFPDESAIGNTFKWENDFTVGAVYEDLPANSVFKNGIYYTRPNDEKYGENQFNFYFFVTLDSPQNADDVAALMDQDLQKYFKGRDNNSVYKIFLTNLSDLYFRTEKGNDTLDNGNKTKTSLMLAIAILIIVIATVNYINFASSMAPLKMKMMNVQRIMGANLWRLRFSIILESVLIALMSFCIAVLLVWMLSGSSFASLWIADISIESNVYTVALSACVALLVGIIAGIYPAFYMTSFPPIMALKGSFAMSRQGRIYCAVLVGFQYFISIVLIISALFVNLQNKHVNNYDLGYDKEQIAIVKITPELYKNNRALSDEVKSNNEIEDVAYGGSKIGSRTDYQNWVFELQGIACESNIMMVSSNFLDVMGIPVVEGRNYRSEDALQDKYFLIFNNVSPRKDNASLIIDDEDGEGSFRVVGFFDQSVHLQTLYVAECPFAFFYNEQMNESYGLSYMYVRIKKGVDRYVAMDKIQKSIKKIDPTFTAQVELLDDQINELYQKDIRVAYLTTIASFLAVLISLIGVFGVVLFEMQFRRREIGVRRVLGSTVEEILLIFNKKFVIITLISFVIAAPVAGYIVNYWMSSFQYRIPVYWWVFAMTLAIVLIITVLTVSLIGWKTANEDPVKSLKKE